jgi:hypothetical protein
VVVDDGRCRMTIHQSFSKSFFPDSCYTPSTCDKQEKRVMNEIYVWLTFVDAEFLVLRIGVHNVIAPHHPRLV